jgi:hypothetical protein
MTRLLFCTVPLFIRSISLFVFLFIPSCGIDLLRGTFWQMLFDAILVLVTLLTTLSTIAIAGDMYKYLQRVMPKRVGKSALQYLDEYVSLAVCLPIYLSAYLSVCLSVCLYLSVYFRLLIVHTQ